MSKIMPRTENRQWEALTPLRPLRPFDITHRPPYPLKPSERRRKVTIAAGFMCQDGILLCADTELTYTDILKYEGSKVRTFQDSETALAITGAGDWEYLRMAFDKVVDRIETSDRSMPAIEGAFEHAVLDIYGRHIPLCPREPKPGFDLLLGVRSDGGKLALFKSSDTAIAKISSFDLVGMGALLGRSAVETLYTPDITVRKCALLAFHLLRLAKKHVPSVGGHSDIASIPMDGEIQTDYGIDITVLEQALVDFHEALRPVALAFADFPLSRGLLQTPSREDEQKSDEAFDLALGRFAQKIRDLRERQKRLQNGRFWP